MVTVHNLKNTGDQLPPSGFKSWQDWWENKKEKKFKLCSRSGCKNNAEVGAHVKETSLLNINESYIVPLCKQCNAISSEDGFEVAYENLQQIDN